MRSRQGAKEAPLKRREPTMNDTMWNSLNETQVMGANPSAFSAHRGIILVTDRSYSVEKVMGSINAGMSKLSEYIAEDPAFATVDIALVSFGTDVAVHNLRFGGTVDSSDFEDQIDDIFVPAKDFPHDLELEAGGLTSLNDALITACDIERTYANHIARKTRKPPLKTVIILLTDGKDEPGGDVTAAAARINEVVRSVKILFLPFGYGNYSEEQFAELCQTDGMWLQDRREPRDRGCAAGPCSRCPWCAACWCRRAG